MGDLLPDEACHVPGGIEHVAFYEFRKGNHNSGVVLHNTMRFDVQMSHVGVLLDDSGIDKSVLATAIREAIVGAVDKVLGTGLDGIDASQTLLVRPVARSQMLHRETLHFDFS